MNRSDVSTPFLSSREKPNLCSGLVYCQIIVSNIAGDIFYIFIVILSDTLLILIYSARSPTLSSSLCWHYIKHILLTTPLFRTLSVMSDFFFRKFLISHFTKSPLNCSFSAWLAISSLTFPVCSTHTLLRH